MYFHSVFFENENKKHLNHVSHYVAYIVKKKRRKEVLCLQFDGHSVEGWGSWWRIKLRITSKGNLQAQIGKDRDLDLWGLLRSLKMSVTIWCHHFSDDEIKKVLWDYESSKIVGLDRVRDVHGKIRVSFDQIQDLTQSNLIGLDQFDFHQYVFKPAPTQPIHEVWFGSYQRVTHLNLIFRTTILYYDSSKYPIQLK